MISRNEVLAAQRKLKDLDSQFQAKTKRLLAEQEKKLKASIEPLETTVIELTKVIRDRNDELAAAQYAFNKINEARISVDEQINTQENILKNKEADIDSVTNSIKQHTAELHELNKKKLSTEGEISVLESRKQALVEEIPGWENKLQIATDRHQAAIDDFDQQIVDKENLIKELDAKLVDQKTRGDRALFEEDQIREELALQRKVLDERDKNLRVREAKVEISEQKIIQNSNLLNL